MSLEGARERQSGQMNESVSYPPPPKEPPRGLPPQATAVPGARPRAVGAGGPGFDLAGWLAAPRHVGTPGVYGLGPAPRVKHEQEDAATTTPAWKLLLRALLNLVVAWEVFYYLIGFVLSFVSTIIPTSWRNGLTGIVIQLATQAVVIALLVRVFGGMGRWPLVWRRYGLPVARAAVRRLSGAGEGRVSIPVQGGVQPQPVDPWREFRPLVHPEDLALVEQETAQGRVADIDHQRLSRALECVRDHPDRLTALLDAVRDHGAAACAHPSGVRDLAGRGAQHDLLLGQVRLGRAEDVPKNPAEYRGTEVALDPVLLGTSLLAVGPAGTGKTARLARPVAEALCLQALSGTAVVVVVGGDGADLGPDSWYDVVIAPGAARSWYGLDLFGGARSADAAAAQLADALLPDELAARTDSARQAMQQVVGPFRAAHGRPPGVRELSLLLRGEPEAWDGLRQALHAAGLLEEYRHELAQRERTRGQGDDPGVLLADRLALLDRPVFAGCFNPSASPAGVVPDSMPLFAMHALDHPLRVRLRLPEHSHPEAARIMARLAVAQFLHAAGTRQDRSLFAGLVVDDASGVIDTHTVRGLQRLRGARAGAVLLLRTLADLPEALREPLFGAVGGRMAFPGIAPWDGTLFAETWGTVWVDEKDVTRAPDTSGGFLKRTWRSARAVLEGEKAQTESVTTRRVERRRWSPSDLAQLLPGGHAVLSLTAVDGTPVPPLLVDLRG
ncbi:ATP-binding protein [Streptacidiphilus sp. P02-A3a]|uniref:ATP-binding protein n=1 Tax=Streptacidiphilus sp. P02-A3a TaxID=2704468 RepID=UPI0015FE68F7|nr:ATP-binding protein [Streptacidiphilus sp. P02-A3a]QMU72299.1 ATP-binding protein [Streptacidiphilus sp. P02-A3a]